MIILVCRSVCLEIVFESSGILNEANLHLLLHNPMKIEIAVVLDFAKLHNGSQTLNQPSKYAAQPSIRI